MTQEREPKKPKVIVMGPGGFGIIRPEKTPRKVPLSLLRRPRKNSEISQGRYP